MLSKLVILAFLAAIVWCLISSFFLLIKEKGEGTRTVWRLTWRAGLSLILFILLYVSFLAGWIQPSGRGPIGLLQEAPQSADDGNGD